jgi:HJR/Mrr/RecB family endonuclease
MTPFFVGQTVRISDAATLAPYAQQSPIVLTPEHVAQAGQSAVIRTVYAAIHDGIQFFFYALDGSLLVWPHAAIATPEARRLTVNHAKPPEPRISRDTNSQAHPIQSDAPENTWHADTASTDVPETKLYVGGVPYSMRDAALMRLFRRFGDLEAVRLIMDRMTGRSRGFGFVTFRDATAADAAAETLNGNDVADSGELLSAYRTDEYLAWLQRSWSITPTGIREYSEEGDVSTRIIAILEESSRRLAQCVAEYPRALGTIEWRDFERMLATVFEGLGFGVTCGRGSKDGGVDLRLTTPSNTYVVQAKHWVSGKKVGGSTLQATVRVAMLEGHGGAIVLSTSGFTRNATTAITSIQRARLRIGEGWEIHSLCRTYVSVGSGLLQPLDPDAVLRTHTRTL